MLNLKNSNVNYGMIISALSTVLSVIFLFSNATGRITADYFNVFFPITVGITLFLWMFTFLETKPKVNALMGFNEQVPESSISKLPLLIKILGIGGVLAAVFSLGAIGIGSSIIDIPQPFTQQALAVIGDTEKIFYQSFIPGFFEEASIYIIYRAILFVTLLVSGIKGLLVKRLGTGAIAAGILTYFHIRAYGSDSAAYVGIFMFEYIVQLANIMSGAFISWIPHTIHNAVVTLNFMSIFSVGGVLAMFIPVWVRRKQNE